MNMDAIDALFLRLDEYQRNMFQTIDQKHRDLVDEINSKFDALNASQRSSDEMNRKTANSVNVVLRIVAVSVDRRICLSRFDELFFFAVKKKTDRTITVSN